MRRAREKERANGEASEGISERDSEMERDRDHEAGHPEGDSGPTWGMQERGKAERHPTCEGEAHRGGEALRHQRPHRGEWGGLS